MLACERRAIHGIVKVTRILDVCLLCACLLGVLMNTIVSGSAINSNKEQ